MDVHKAGASKACCLERWATSVPRTSNGTPANFLPPSSFFVVVFPPRPPSSIVTHPETSSLGERMHTFRPARASRAPAYSVSTPEPRRRTSLSSSRRLRSAGLYLVPTGRVRMSYFLARSSSSLSSSSFSSFAAAVAVVVFFA